MMQRLSVAGDGQRYTEGGTIINRRSFIQFTATCAGSILMSNLVGSCSTSKSMEATIANPIWLMPDESDPHKRTWMSFGASRKIWGQKLLPGVQDNLATIAKAIAKFEPVYMLVRQADYDIAARKCGSSVNLVVSPLDDLWMRDIGPVFIKDDRGNLGGIDFNFNGWGEKQDYNDDAQVANFVIQQSKVQAIQTKLVLEGGGIEVDGHGTAIITESCVLNQNRNPGMSKSECEALLKPLLGLRKIIWLPGIRGKDITDGHTDFYARFASSGFVVAGSDPDPASFDHLVTQNHLEILRSATDADGRKLEVIVLEGPKTIRPQFETQEFAAGYINFYIVNGAVMVPEFGDAMADSKAKSTLQELFPDRDIVQLNIDAIAAGGGGIHCTTQQEPLA
ncbi:MAG: agmatine deiminase family protein [Microcoleus sp.]|uniref:agmatine deiminase family protein n=1 Tax=Microcoleus anatoxicus TaxID=2705319 RepID=UPI0035E77DD3